MASKHHVGRDGDEESQGHDRLSDLPDHILLCVLERLRDDVRALARTCVLSKRWRTLPLMISNLNISARTFLVPADRTTSNKRERVLHATGRFAAAVRFFLATGGDQRRAIKTLTLRLYLTEVDHLVETVRLVGGAIGRGEVHDLELVVYTEMGKNFLGAEPRRLRISLCYGLRFTRLLLRDAPSAVPRSLKKLTLQNLSFKDPSAEVGTLLRACVALEVLALDYCGFYNGDLSSTLTIDAPDSQIKVLSFNECYVGSVHVVQAPRLVLLICKEWCTESCPVTFGAGSVPSLEEIDLSNRAETWQLSFGLSDLLQNTRGVATLRLAFDNNKIWVRPENPKNLGAAFSNIKVLHLLSIFPEGDLSWIMFLLHAAPCLEFVNIEVYKNHVCWRADADNDDKGDDVRYPEWEVPQGFRHHHLRCLRVSGGIDAGKDGRFARLVMERAVSLELLVLDARIMCEGCIDAQRLDPSIVLSKFSEDKEAVDALVRRQVKGGIASSARVLVYSASNQEFQY
ncbi:unnamed protein product [Urochloa humidicola]